MLRCYGDSVKVEKCIEFLNERFLCKVNVKIFGVPPEAGTIDQQTTIFFFFKKISWASSLFSGQKYRFPEIEEAKTCGEIRTFSDKYFHKPRPGYPANFDRTPNIIVQMSEVMVFHCITVESSNHGSRFLKPFLEWNLFYTCSYLRRQQP